MHTPPSAWLTLSDYQRDILLTLYQETDLSGVEIHEHIGGVDGRARYEKIYGELKDLRSQDLVSVGDEYHDGHKQHWRIAPKGDMLVERVADLWRGL